MSAETSTPTPAVTPPAEPAAKAAEPPVDASAESADPSEQSQDGPQPLDPAHLTAAVAEAMVLSGLGHRADLVETFLTGSMARFVRDGTIDLGLLWQTLVIEMYMGRQQVAQTLLLTAIYIAETFQAPVAVPQDAQEIMETLLPSEEARSAAGQKLRAAVEARTRRQSKERAANAPPPEKDKDDTRKSGGKGKERRSTGSSAGADKGKVKGKEPRKTGDGKDGKDDRGRHAAPTVAELRDGKKPRKASLDNPVVAIAAGLLLLGLGGYWVNELVIKEIELDHKRQDFLAQKTVDPESLPAGVKIKEASLRAAVLKIHLADDSLTKMSDKQRAQIAADFLATLDKVGALRLHLYSDAKRYLVNKDPDGLVTVKVYDLE